MDGGPTRLARLDRGFGAFTNLTLFSSHLLIGQCSNATMADDDDWDTDPDYKNEAVHARRKSEGAINAVDAKGFEADASLNEEKDANNTETDKEHALDHVQKSTVKPSVENMPHKPEAVPSTVHTTGR